MVLGGIGRLCIQVRSRCTTKEFIPIHSYMGSERHEALPTSGKQYSTIAQRKSVGLITQRSFDRNEVVLEKSTFDIEGEGSGPLPKGVIYFRGDSITGPMLPFEDFLGGSLAPLFRRTVLVSQNP